LALGSVNIPEGGKGFPLAISLNANLISNQRDGEVRAEATFVKKGKLVIVVNTKVKGSDDKLLAEITTTHVLAK